MPCVRYRSIQRDSPTGKLVESISVKTQFLFVLLLCCDSRCALAPVPEGREGEYNRVTSLLCYYMYIVQKVVIITNKVLPFTKYRA